MDYRSLDLWIDVAVEYIWNGANFMLGVMVAQGQIVTPSRTAWLVALITGLVGSMNHIRALRRVPEKKTP